jgi:aspartyl-tRNA(Asn)/glutamyl-tRNA(Gln) amidotransferase subunit B
MPTTERVVQALQAEAMETEAVIGLEIHAQLLTESKIFCGCSTQFGADPNENTCPICSGMPGVLPVLNRKVVELALRTAVALHGTIAARSEFARKNYFYPDLPKGYQISQYEAPLSKGGYLEVESSGRTRRIGITRIHLEEDAGKLVYEGTMERADAGFVDLNRTGVPLIEIVTEPDIRSPEEAGAFLRKLRSILRYLGVCDGNMEQGSLRCDANVSIRPRGAKGFGVKTELKNMNSFRYVERALKYEIQRQVAALEDGEKVIQETRLWDASKNATLSMRSKEEAHDYRYFPDPDLVPVEVDPAWVEEVRKGLPELPEEKENRFVEQYQLPREDARILTATAEMADYFEKAVGHFPQAKNVSNWILTELLRELNRDDREIDRCPVTPEHLARMLSMIEEGSISGKIAKQVFEEMYRTGKDPQTIVKDKGWVQIQDSSELAGAIERVLREHPDEVEKYRAGKEKVFGFLVGQVMKATRGQANPKLVNDLLRKRLQATD